MDAIGEGAVVRVLQQGCFPAPMLQSPAIFLQQSISACVMCGLGRQASAGAAKPNRKQNNYDNGPTPHYIYMLPSHKGYRNRRLSVDQGHEGTGSCEEIVFCRKGVRMRFRRWLLGRGEIEGLGFKWVLVRN
jgi:hypothetical protein